MGVFAEIIAKSNSQLEEAPTSVGDQPKGKKQI